VQHPAKALRSACRVIGNEFRCSNRVLSMLNCQDAGIETAAEIDHEACLNSTETVAHSQRLSLDGGKLRPSLSEPGGKLSPRFAKTVFI
jgi:hypothetical protein